MSEIRSTDPTIYDAIGVGVPRAQEDPNRQALGQNEFFELMIAQLTHQDPLEPLDSESFLAQVAQFSTVTGIQTIERSIASLVQSMESNQALQASTLVGRDVLVAAEKVETGAGEPVNGAVETPITMLDARVVVTSPTGEKVREMALGEIGPGLVRFAWDGRDDAGEPVASGKYTISASGVIEGTSTALPTYIEARVEAVTLGAGGAGMTLNLEGLGTASVGEIRELS